MSNSGQGRSWVCAGLVVIAVFVGLCTGLLLLLALRPSAACQQCVPCPQASVLMGAGPWGGEPCSTTKGERPAPEPSMGAIRGMSWGDIPLPNQIPDVSQPGMPQVESWNPWIDVTLLYAGSGNDTAFDLDPAEAVNDTQKQLIEALIAPRPAQTNNIGYYEHAINRIDYEVLGDPNPCFKLRLGEPVDPLLDIPKAPWDYSPPMPPWELMTGGRENPSEKICPFAMHTYQFQYDFPSAIP